MPATAYVLGPDRLGNCAWIDGDQWRWFGRGPAPRCPSAELLPCPDAEIRPGWVNGHTHLYSGAVPYGVQTVAPRDRGLLPILQSVWWQLDRAMDHGALLASAKAAVADALMLGTTVLFDHLEAPNCIDGSLDVVAEACAALGIRASLTYGATERNGGAAELLEGLRECDRFVRARKPAQVRGCVGVHAGFTVTDFGLRRAGQLARQLQAPMHIHAAEDPADVAYARARGHGGALFRLLDVAELPAGSILAHGNFFDRAEVTLIGRRGLWVAQNPRSNLGNGLGYAANLRGCGNTMLGSDGWPSDMEAEMRCARDLGGAYGEAPDMAWRRLRAGWACAQEHFGVRLGWPDSEPVAADVCAMGPGGAVHVLVGGKLVVRDGQLLTGNLPAIRKRAKATARDLNAKMAAMPSHRSAQP